jgi:hypothetical protein
MAHNIKPNPSQGIDFDTLAKMDLGALVQFLTSLDQNQAATLFQNLKIDPNDERFRLKEGDPRLNMLSTLKSFVPPENAQIIDQIIKVFSAHK